MSHDLSVKEALGDRQVLPRWRSPSESTEELSTGLPVTKQLTNSGAGWIAELRQSFAEYPTAATATELRETAFVLGVELTESESADVLKFNNGVKHKVADANKSKPLGLLSDEYSLIDSALAITSLRSQLRGYPKQPLAWAELSRRYLSLGQKDRAEQSMLCALNLAPNSNYIVRSAVRLYNQVKQPGQAISILKRNKRTARDPWLLAAEIATSSVVDQTSRHMNIAAEMVKAKSSVPRHVAELAAALGTVEYQNGHHKRAKQLFAQSMVDPTENSVAQALWISQQDSSIVLPEAAMLTPASYEAQARAAYAEGDWARSLNQSDQWLYDEPFDQKPAILGSFVSFVPELAAPARDIATRGLLADKNSALLLNNRAVAHAYCGQINNAYEDLKNALKVRKDEPHLLATLGLIAYRAGAVDFGQRAYTMSVAWFASQKDPASLARAYLYWLREGVIAGTTNGAQELVELKGIVERLPTKDKEGDLYGLINQVELAMLDRQSGLQEIFLPQLGVDVFEELEIHLDIPQKARSIYDDISDENIVKIERAAQASEFARPA